MFFSDFAIWTYFSNFERKEIKSLLFKKVDLTCEIATFDIPDDKNGIRKINQKENEWFVLCFENYAI